MTIQVLNIPKLRFSGFSNEWEIKKLNQIAKVNPSTKELPEKFIYIDLESVTSGQLIKEDTILRKGAPSRAQRTLEINDVLYQTVRPYQMNNLFFDKEGEYVASTGYAQLRANQDPRYLFQYLHTKKFVDNVMERCTGTSYPAINSTDLANITISIPPLPEQQKIASFLTSIDTKIQQLTQKKTILEQYKKGVMQKIFNQEIRFMDENGKEFPEWEEKRLRDLVVFRNGKAHEQDINEKGKYIVVNSKFISSNGKVKKYSLNQICKLEKGEIVMVMSDVPKGKALAKCFYIDKDDQYTLNQRICALKTKNMESKYLIYLLNRNRYYLEFDSGVGQTNLTLHEVLNCPLIVSNDFKEQTRIANFLTTIDKKIDLVNTQLEKTNEWKKGLLQQLFV